MRQTRFRVDHLLFEHSSVGLRRQLEHRAGIHGVTTDPQSSLAIVTYDQERLASSDVARLISESGYECSRVDYDGVEQPLAAREDGAPGWRRRSTLDERGGTSP